MLRRGQLGEPEIQQFHHARRRQHYIRGLQIAVHHARAMRRLEAPRNLDRTFERLAQRHPFPRDRLIQWTPLHQFHHQGRRIAALFPPVYRSDVRVIERRQDFPLALEPRSQLAVPHQGVGKHLNRHHPPQLGIARAIDLAHPTLAQEGDDFVGPDPVSWRVRHAC